MVVLQIVRVGAVATCRHRLDEVVVTVLFLHLVITHQHLRIHAGWILSRLSLAIERYRVALFLSSFQVAEEAQLVHDIILVQIVQLARHFLVATCYQGRAYVAVVLQIQYHWLILSVCLHGVAHFDVHCLLRHHNHLQ